MRKEFAKILRQAFGARLRTAAPGFGEMKLRSDYLGPGERAYADTVGEHIRRWIVLSPSAKDRDEFTVLIGWSTLGRYPELGMIPCADMPSEARTEFAREEYLIRLSMLWSTQDPWWVVRPWKGGSLKALQASMAPITPEEAERRVIPAVDDAIGRLVDIGLPYLDEFARAVGARGV